ncbi:ethanolamine utilization microcompartment protein EutL [Stomatohabitans albus]|uniref:ethanolamine utilization microcompartment protein EutL n=1 Tax=Stomatohabitans albus TaxID=3110766 RepID=UPI00300CCCE0
MATLDPIKPTILATRILTRVQPDYAKAVGMPDGHRSLAILTCDIDDSLYVALDEATKAAQVEVVYAKSFYAGSGNASGPLSGEVIGMLSAPTPAEAEAGLRAAIDYAENEAWFYAADDLEEGVACFSHVISRTGSYLSKEAGIPLGDPLAYLIAPPLEATYAVDLALKAADVELKEWFGPPSETNFAGAWLTGSQSSCRAAAEAFQHGVIEIANNPRIY